MSKHFNDDNKRNENLQFIKIYFASDVETLILLISCKNVHVQQLDESGYVQQLDESGYSVRDTTFGECNFCGQTQRSIDSSSSFGTC